MKVALVYDRINKWGGAERVLLALHELFPKASLFTSLYNQEKASWAKVLDVKTSFLQNFSNVSSSHEKLAFLMPIAFETLSFDNYDLVISLTSEAAKGIITKPHTIHVCYCLTPTRYLWSGYKEYFKNLFFKIISFPAVYYLKKWDKIAAKRPDAYIAISKEVKNRIKKYYARDSIVVYPPLTIQNYKLQITKSKQITNPKLQNTGYFLIVSRLVPYKRVDLAIDAFNQLKLPLKIAGIGSEERRLRLIANSNIEFLGNLTDNDLLRYYKECDALIFPGKEDFGLTIAEAQFFGKPVIAYKEGGALEIVVKGKTGEFFERQDAESLIKTVLDFDPKRYKSEDCIKNAQKFSKKKFKKDFLNVLRKIIKA